MRIIRNLSSLFFLVLWLLFNCNPSRQPEQAIQKPVFTDSGTLVFRKGNSTVFYQKFKIRNDSIQSRILPAKGKGMMAIATGMMAPDGIPESLRIVTYSPADSGQWKPGKETIVRSKNDSITVNTVRNSHIIRDVDHKYLSIRIEKELCFIPFPFSRAISGYQAGTGARRKVYVLFPDLLDIDREGAAQIGSEEGTDGGSLILYLSSGGKLDSIRGEGAVSDMSGIVYRNFDFDSLAVAFARPVKVRKRNHNASVDSVVFANGDLNVKLKYSRPSLDGRKIFGFTVPYNEVWVTGTDSAVEFSVNQPVSFYGQRISEGRYSLLTIPRQDLWILIINRQTGITGKDYNPSFDVLRVPMKVDSLASLINTLTINIMPYDTGGLMTIKWENTGAAVMFK